MRFDYTGLKRMRKKNYLKQCEVGKMMHCSTSNICKWELGKIRLGVDEFVKLAEIYGIDDFNGFFVDRRK